MREHPLDEAVAAAGARYFEIDGALIVSDFGEPRAEYDAGIQSAGLYDARERGLLEVSGSDRAAWLHNLVANTVKTVGAGEGNYAFVLNVKGRILFDCNILVLADRIWVDLDRRFAAKAMSHFGRYHITEDVQLTDRSSEFCRITLVGPRAAEIAGALGATQAGNMATLGSTAVVLAHKPRLMVRTDFAGTLALEFYIESVDAPGCWNRLIEIGRGMLRPIGDAAIEVMRIEAGIPLYGRDIDEDTLPAETAQLDRAVSFVKGCYLGQEIVERMRSRGGLARKLVGLKLASSDEVHPGAALKVDGAEVGRLTSVCESYAAAGTIGLGYVKTAYANPGTKLVVTAPAPIEAEVQSLPFRK